MFATKELPGGRRASCQLSVNPTRLTSPPTCPGTIAAAAADGAQAITEHNRVEIIASNQPLGDPHGPRAGPRGVVGQGPEGNSEGSGRGPADGRFRPGAGVPSSRRPPSGPDLWQTCKGVAREAQGRGRAPGNWERRPARTASMTSWPSRRRAREVRRARPRAGAEHHARSR